MSLLVFKKLLNVQSCRCTAGAFKLVGDKKKNNQQSNVSCTLCIVIVTINIDKNNATNTDTNIRGIQDVTGDDNDGGGGDCVWWVQWSELWLLILPQMGRRVMFKFGFLSRKLLIQISKY